MEEIESLFEMFFGSVKPTPDTQIREGSSWKIRDERLDLIPKPYPTRTCTIDCYSRMVNLITVEFENGVGELFLPDKFLETFEPL